MMPLRLNRICARAGAWTDVPPAEEGISEPIMWTRKDLTGSRPRELIQITLNIANQVVGRHLDAARALAAEPRSPQATIASAADEIFSLLLNPAARSSAAVMRTHLAMGPLVLGRRKRMQIKLKAPLVAAALGLGAITAANAAQQPQAAPRGDRMPMTQAQTMPGERPMMNDPQARARMSMMMQGCHRMMQRMGNMPDQHRPAR